MSIRDLIWLPVGAYVSFIFLKLGIGGAIIGRLNLSYDILWGFRPTSVNPSQNPNYFKGIKARIYGAFFLLLGLYFIWATLTDLMTLLGIIKS